MIWEKVSSLPPRKQKAIQIEKKESQKKQCTRCLEYRDLSKDFYISYSSNHGDGRVHLCKSCLIAMFNSKYNGKNEHDAINDLMKQIDKPYIYNLVDSSKESAESGNKSDSLFSAYMKNVVMRQYGGMTYKDSVFPGKEIPTKETNKSKRDEFVLTDEIIDKWGEGYTQDEYKLFEKKWNKLIDNYGEKTALHIEGLITYIRFRVKEELATAASLVKEAKDWGTLAKEAAVAAKINVSQLSKSDISGGVDLLPQLFEAVESEVGIIPTLPKLREQPYDDADIIIWCVVNYVRRLEDKPRVAYKEIWNFYDVMLEDFYKQKGFSQQDIETEKKKRNNVFRDLGEVYVEPLYEDGDM